MVKNTPVCVLHLSLNKLCYYALLVGWFVLYTIHSEKNLKQMKIYLRILNIVIIVNSNIIASNKFSSGYYLRLLERKLNAKIQTLVSILHPLSF